LDFGIWILDCGLISSSYSSIVLVLEEQKYIIEHFGECGDGISNRYENEHKNDFEDEDEFEGRGRLRSDTF